MSPTTSPPATGIDDGERTEGVGARRDQVEAQPLVVEEVREEADHVEQGEGDPRAESPEDDGEGHETQDVRRRGEVSERSLR